MLENDTGRDAKRHARFATSCSNDINMAVGHIDNFLYGMVSKDFPEPVLFRRAHDDEIAPLFIGHFYDCVRDVTLLDPCLDKCALASAST
jgi:hypothetical protein